jgi:broad specificity phosphatase PhoE
MKLYLVRHGQTDWNLKKIAQGQTDTSLNATGIQQAEALRDKLASYQIDACYCSPLTRTTQTAQIIINDRCPIIFDNNLKERFFGELEGTSPDTWTEDVLDLRLNSTLGGCESLKDTLIRSQKALNRIKAEQPADAHILIVGHGALLKTVHYCIVGYNEDTDFRGFHIHNGEIVEYDI